MHMLIELDLAYWKQEHCNFCGTRQDMNEEKKEDYKFIVEHLREMMIFWAVLVLTTVAGIIELFPEIKQPFNVQMCCISAIYFALLFGMSFSIWRVFDIYRELRNVALSGKLDSIIQEHANNKKTEFDRIIDLSHCRYFEISIIVPTIVVFGLLYFARLFVW